MQNKSFIFHYLTGLLSLALLALLSWPTSFVAAQNTAPTPIPTVPANALVVIAGGHGATLYQADGTELAQLAPGDRLLATKRSSDEAWLYVTAADATSGWVGADQIIAFYRMALPTEELTLTIVAPTAEPTTVAAAPAPTETTTSGTTADSSASTTAPTAVAATTTGRIVTDGSRLNVRSGPGTAYSIIAKVASGQSVQLMGRSADGAWSQIALPEQPAELGWVASRFITGGDAAALPLTEAPMVNNAAPTPAAVTSAPAGGLRGKLVFQDRQGGMIYLYGLDSGALTTLTRGFDPSLSPDGSRVVFTRGGGENGIYLINSDGSDEHKIFGERELLRSPKWSPDGQWIVFERGDEFNKCYIDKETGACFPFTPFDTKGLATGKDHVRKLARIDPNGNSYRDLAVVEEAMAPDWSSGGIVYQSGAGLQITKDTAGDPNRKLYFDILRQYHQDPDWQPNGDRIVFQQRQGSHYEIFAINQDGGGLTGLTRPATALVDQMPSNVAPAWSPDGSQIVFLSNRTATNEAGPWHLWVMHSDGSNQQQLPINVALQYDYVTEQMVDWGR